jgi:hypothetical protein
MTFEKKPSTAEEEYFAREEAETLRRLHYEEMKRLRESEKEALRKLACGGAFLSKAAWDHLQSQENSHKVVEAVLNWFKSANKP